MKRINYDDWSIHPSVIDVGKYKRKTGIWKRMTTKHEGDVLYYKLWNFWVRAGTRADMRSDRFFRDYERANSETVTSLTYTTVLLGFKSLKTQ